MQEYLVQSRSDARAILRSADSSPEEVLEKARTRARRDTLLLLQHTPVYTEGRRGGEYAQTPEEVEQLTQRFHAIGAEYHQTLRGGLITFHGPGQLVGYPILDLGSMGVSTKCYVDKLQRVFRNVLAQRKLPSVDPPQDHTGVWTDEQHKITSLGIRVRHRITSHGFAFNVEQEALEWFRYIVACGIQGKSMTCLQREIVLRNLANKRPSLSSPAPAVGGSITYAQGSSGQVSPDLSGDPTSTVSRQQAQAGQEVDDAGTKPGLSTPLPGTSPNVGTIDPALPLDAEAAAVSVRSVVPDVLHQFGAVFERVMEPEPSPDLAFIPDSAGMLRQAIVDGHVIE